jgi:hypothetical protein
MSRTKHETRSSIGRDRSAVPRRCTLDGFTAEVTRATGVGLGELEALTTVLIRTLNSLYRIVVLEPPRQRILIQGGEFFPEPTEARLAGASFGGSMLKLSWFGCGLRMEVCSDGQRIVTSPVQSIEVQREKSPAHLN